jgi:uncharacterized protein DUF4153
LLVIAALDPERFVAERNVARYGETGKIDESYLASLSADATPALAALPVRSGLRARPSGTAPAAGRRAVRLEPRPWPGARFPGVEAGHLRLR